MTLPAVSWPPIWRRGRPAPARSTARPRRWRAPPASPRCRSIVAAAAHTEYDTGLSLRRGVRSGAVLGGAAKGVRAVRIRAARRRRDGCITTRSPAVSCRNLRQQAIALGLGDRFEEIEENYAAADRILGRLVKVTPSSKVVGDLALALVGAGVTADEFAADPARFDIPDSVIGFLRGELGDPPGGWPEPLRTKALAGRAAGQAAPRSSPPRTRRRCATPGPKRQADAQPAAVPRSRQRNSRRTARSVRRHLAAVGQPVLLRAAPRRRAPRQARARRRAADRARGDLRSRRTRHAHGDVHPQRPAASGGGARPQHRQRGPRRGEGRPGQPRPRRRAVRRRGHRRGRRRRQGRRRPDHRHHRGDEDGSRHHRPEGGHRRTRSPCRRPRRSRAATCWWWSADPHRRRRRRRAAHRGARRAAPGPTTDRVRESLFNVLAARHGPARRVGARPVRRLRCAGPRGAVARRGQSRCSSSPTSGRRR